MLYLRLQRDAEAENSFRETLQRDSRSANSYYGLAKILQRQEKLEAALRAVDEAAELAPASYNAHFTRAKILQPMGKKEEAELEFAEAKKFLDAKVDKDREELKKSVPPSPELKTTPN
jgi:Tfp pilus assembly protein PilF